MKKKQHSDFLTLIRNKNFVESIRNSENKNELLEDLINAYPQNRKSVIYAFEFICANLSDETKLNSHDYQEILHNILEYSRNKKNNTRRIFINNLWKAAAIFIVISAGAIIGYNKLGNEKSLEKFAQVEFEEEDKGMIVLSDGSKRVLEENDSYIEYHSDEGDIIVKNADKQEEKIENPKNKEELNQIIVPYGQTHTVALNDGTIVQLNAGSKLTFPAAFKGKIREVYLKGEGYFDVVKDAERPFKVITDHIDIEVLGTTFNVAAYNDEDQVSAVLVEGKVKVSQKNKVFANEEFVIEPGEGCFYSVSSKESVVQQVNLDDYISWKDGWFTFKQMRLSDIASRLKKYYNETIHIEGDVLSSTLVTGKLVLSDNFIEVLQSLSLTVEGNYVITDEGEYIIRIN